MHLSDFDYHLPPERIAQTPAEPRDSARLLMLGRQDWSIKDAIFHNIVDHLWDNDVLVVNSTHVIKAHLKGKLAPKTVLQILPQTPLS